MIATRRSTRGSCKRIRRKLQPRRFLQHGKWPRHFKMCFFDPNRPAHHKPVDVMRMALNLRVVSDSNRVMVTMD